MRRRRLLGGAALALLALAAGPAAAAEFVVEPVTVEETKAVFGQVESRDLVPARARIGGTVATVAVEAGSEVAAGELVATVVDDKLTLQRDAADAEILALRSQLDNARTELARAEQLLAGGNATQSRVDQARTAVEVLVNQLAAAEAGRAVIVQQLSEGEVRAPVAGRVLSVPVTPGSVVMAGEPVVRIAGGGFFLRLALPERHASAIEEGDTVRVGRRVLVADDTAPPEAEEGRLAKVYPEIEGGRVIADVEVEGLGGYFVGERTLVWIPVGERQVLAVPAAAVTTRHGVDYVTLTAGEGTAEVAVILGGDAGEGRVEILSGLRASDRVIVP